MKTTKNRLELAIIVSIALHFVLLGLLLLGSFFTDMIKPSAGGSGGDSEAIDAVMVDTAQVAQAYKQLQVEKQVEQQTPPTPIVKDNSESSIADKQREEEKRKAEQEKLEQERLKALAQQEQQKELKRQQELAKQEQLKKQQEAEALRKKEAEAARLKAEAEAKRLEAAAKQAEEERKAKLAEQKRLEQKKAEQLAKAQAEKEAKEQAEKSAKLKADQEAKLKAEKEAKLKAEKEAKLKAEKEAKLKAEKEAKLKAEKEAKLKAEKEAKAKAEAEAKAKAEQNKKNQKALDDFLSGNLSNGGNRNAAGSQGNGNAKSVGDGFGTEDRGYENLIKKKLARFYRVDESFRGRECRVKLFLERDGRISNYQVISGPDDICRAAVSAVVSAKTVPPAPSDPLYNKYKSPIMRFSLKIQ